MTDRPILFSAPMIRALLDGAKTQTRRVLRRHKWAMADHEIELEDDGPYVVAAATGCMAKIPVRFAKGDRLWVKETHALTEGGGVRYYATDHVNDLRRKRVSIHMPRWASRLTPIVTDVAVQRLDELTEADAIAEGVRRNPTQADKTWMIYPEGCSAAGYLTAKRSYESLMDSLHGAGFWAGNPWVVALKFDVLKMNISSVPA